MAIEGGAIAIFLPSLGMGGAERVATTLANAWAGAGQEVHVLTFVKSVNSFQLSPAVRSYDISRGSDVNDIIEILLLAVNLRRYIKRNGIKYFLALGDKYGVLASLALWGTGVRVTVSDRSSPTKHRAWWFRMLKRYAYRRADAVIAQTGASAQVLGRYIDFDKIFVVPNPILAPPSMNSERREKIVLNVGRLVPEKGHVHLLRAFAAIPKSEWILVIVGDGPLRSRLQVVGRELGIEDRVVWIGQCDDVSFWYGRASILIGGVLYLTLYLAPVATLLMWNYSEHRKGNSWATTFLVVHLLFLVIGIGIPTYQVGRIAPLFLITNLAFLYAPKRAQFALLPSGLR